MKITLEIPDDVIAGFFNVVRSGGDRMWLASYQLGTDDLFDGNTVKLPRERDGDQNAAY